MTTHIPAGAVVVGVDGSEHSGVALAWAVQHAQREARPLVIAHATGRLSPLHPTPDRGAARHARRIPGRRIVDGALRLAGAAGPDLAVETVVRVDDPVPVLLDLAKGASLVVVGSRGRGPLAGTLLGSVSVAVSEGAPCPVVVVRSRRSATATRVLVAVRASGEDGDALEFAARHVAQNGGSLVVVHVTDGATGTGVEAEAPPWDVDPAFLARHPRLDLTLDLISGPLDAYLIEESRTADLVVVGAHGGSPLGAALRGSKSQHVIESAACSVAVVPTRVVAGAATGSS